jgi:hypothetical protein
MEKVTVHSKSREIAEAALAESDADIFASGSMLWRGRHLVAEFSIPGGAALARHCGHATPARALALLDVAEAAGKLKISEDSSEEEYAVFEALLKLEYLNNEADNA